MSSTDTEEGKPEVERKEDIEKNPAGVVRRWALELQLADKREKPWRKKAKGVWDRYRQDESASTKHAFNILWSNTETLRPAVYNSTPSPDVRRRFKDADPLGKAVADVLSRALTFGIDSTDFDYQMRQVVLDALLPGRGCARVRYVPTLTATDETQESGESLEGEAEELAWEQAVIEHVQWDDLRIGPGKEWGEVQWIAFRHELTRDDLVEKFGDVGELVPLDKTEDEDIEKGGKDVEDAFKTAEIWEIWDKEERQVIFISTQYKKGPLQELDDPMGLVDFFPIPRPIYAIEDSATLVPTALYELYREQAEELDRISYRINKIIAGMKLRGVHDSTIPELAQVMQGDDNDLIPAQNVTALLERGGLDKAVWFMPIDQCARVLQILYQQREATKQVIYEISGISDILRGASVATETATAQQIKANWGSARLKRLQGDCARFARDLLRMQAEIIAEKFQIETLQQMTGLQLMTGEQKQAAIASYQQQALQASATQQPVPPPPKLPISWDEVQQVLRSDGLRTFKVDIETDSTVAASIESDMQGLRDVLTGVGQAMQSFGPAVMQGFLPAAAVKEVLLAIIRRAKLGNAVEDAFEAMQDQPAGPQQGAAQAQQAEAQQQQAQQQQQMQLEAQKMQAEAATKIQIEQMRLAAQKEIEQARAQQQAAIEAQKLEFERYRAELDARTRIEIAQSTTPIEGPDATV